MSAPLLAERDLNPTGAPPRTAAWPAWLRLTVGDLLLALCVVGLLPRSRDSLLDDPGLGWHLRNIDAMVAAGGWLERDPFSGPRHGEPWLTNQWLGELPLWLGWRWGGLEGIAAVTVLALAALARLLYSLLLADDVPWPLAAAWSFAGLLGISLSWVARPNLFTIFGVLLLGWLLDRRQRGKLPARYLAWLLPLFAVWANAHGGFTAGLLMLGLAWSVDAAVAVLGPDRLRAAARRRLVPLAVAGLAAFAGTLCNPYGWRLYPWIGQLLGNPFFMGLHTEWLSPDFHAAGAFRFEWLLLALPGLLAWSRTRLGLTCLALTLFWLHMALSGQRYVALWVVVAVPALARLSSGLPWLRRFCEGIPLSPELRQALLARPRRSTPGPALAMAILLLCWARGTDGYSGHAPAHLPVAALEEVRAAYRGGQVFHDYNWGGWLTWHGWPEIRNWIDDRNEVQGQAHIEQYFRLVRGVEPHAPIFAAHDVRLVCIRPEAPLARLLAADPAWRERRADAWAVVFERTANESP